MINELSKRIFTSLILLFVVLFCLFYSETTWLILVVFLCIVCFYEFYNLIKKIYKNKIFIFLSLFLIFLYLYFFQFLITKIRYELGGVVILILLIACISSDVGGYIVGKTIGGPKLTRISPKKTISGSLGSIMFTIIGTSTFVIFFNLLEQTPINFENNKSNIFYIWLILISICCQLGDLLISYMKRKASVKDTGNILPGHGGILDRVDGILLAIPFGILLIIY